MGRDRIMDKESFESEQKIVNWLTENGFPFVQAVCIVSMAQTKNITICQSCVDLLSDLKKEKNV